jgi:hypothetical protein
VLLLLVEQSKVMEQSLGLLLELVQPPGWQQAWELSQVLPLA